MGLVVKLWGTVPLGDGVVSHGGIRVGKAASETEIGKFDFTVCGNEQVVWLDISVEDEVFMTEPDSATQHDHPCFDVGGPIVDVVDVLDEFEQVSLGQVFEDEIEVLRFGTEDGVETDDVWVVELL